MLKKTLFTALLALAATAYANAGQEVLINGAPAQKDAATLQFDGDKATVAYTDGSTFTYDMEEVEVRFSQSSSAATAPAAFLKLNTVVNDVINIDGANKGDVVKIADAKGVVLFYTVAADCHLNIDATPFAPGVYMLTIGNQSVKFVKE